MNFNDLQGLQEAYTQINQLDEVLDTPEKANEYGKKVVKSVLGAATKAVVTKDKEHLKTIDKRIKGAKMAKRKAERKAAEEAKESYDLYDIILSHLLDEGYASTEEAADKIILNMSESWFEDIMELNRYEKETGKDLKTGKPVTKGGTMGGDDTNSKVMRHMHKVMGSGRMGAGGPIQERGKKKEKGKKPPAAGEHGSGVKSPEQKVKMRRADAERSKEMMHSARD